MQQVESIDRDIAVVGDHGWEASISGLPFFMLLACKMAARIRYGALKFILPDGRVLRFSGAEEIESEGVIIVKRWAFARRSVLGGDIGFFESFSDGDWESPSVTDVLYLFARNADVVREATVENSLESATVTPTMIPLDTLKERLEFLDGNKLNESSSNLSTLYAEIGKITGQKGDIQKQVNEI